MSGKSLQGVILPIGILPRFRGSWISFLREGDGAI
jgi:hypothetical protein